MGVKIISVFNNKGGVGKTTLTFHLAHALADMGHKVLAVDLDPQCNLSIFSLPEDYIQKIWDSETPFIDGSFEDSKAAMPDLEFGDLCKEPRTIHFLLKPAEEGTGAIDQYLPPPIALNKNFHLIPGRLTLHMFEEQLAKRWSEAFIGQPLAIRTLSEMRRTILRYAEAYEYDYVIVDTSPSLGQLNKTILTTTVDAFLIPCAPDLFSLYGIRNIGNSLDRWIGELKSFYHLIPPSKRPQLPGNFVGFLGYCIYNAKKREGSTVMNMAIAHHNYAKLIPDTVTNHLHKDLSIGITKKKLKEPIGGQSVMHSHNTYPAQAQKYHLPMWELPDSPRLEDTDRNTINSNRDRFQSTRLAYRAFAEDVLKRVNNLDQPDLGL